MSYKPDLSDLEIGRGLAHRAARRAHRRRHRERRPGAGREAADDARARRARLDQPPDGRARLPAAGRAGLRRRARRPRDVRALAPARGRAAAGRRGLAARRSCPPRQGTYAEQMLAESLGAGRDAIPLAAGFPAARAAAHRRDGEPRGADPAPTAAAGLRVPAGRGAARAARAARGARRRRAGWAQRRRRRSSSRPAPARRSTSSRARCSGPGDVVVDRVADVRRLARPRSGRRARRCSPLPVDEDGVDVAALERLLARHEIKLVVLQPACHNPTGADLSAGAPRAPGRARPRARLLRPRGRRLRDDGARRPRAPAPARARPGARRLRRLAVEDDRRRAARRLDRRRAGPIRGRLVAPEDGRRPARSAALPQHLAAAWLRGRPPRARTSSTSCRIYRARRDVLLDALERHLGDEATWTVPRGGQHVWVTLRRARRRAGALRRGAARAA